VQLPDVDHVSPAVNAQTRLPKAHRGWQAVFSVVQPGDWPVDVLVRIAQKEGPAAAPKFVQLRNPEVARREVAVEVRRDEGPAVEDAAPSLETVPDESLYRGSETSY